MKNCKISSPQVSIHIKARLIALIQKREIEKMKKRKHFDKEYKPKCYKCGKKIKELIKFNWFRENSKYSAGYFDAAEKANNKVVRVGAELYRHSRKRCEPLWSSELN